MKVQRLLYKARNIAADYGRSRKELCRVETEEEANLRSSEVSIGWVGKTFIKFREELHAPALDIDKIHCELIPSSTKGNWHLYIDKPMPWEDYVKLLKVLVDVGIIEEGFYTQSMAEGRSTLRVRNKKYDHFF